MRVTLSIIAGLVVGVVVIAAVEAIGHMLFPPPEDIDLTDPAQLDILIESLPLEALVSVLVAWGLGALAGGAVAGKIARRQWQPASATVGAFLLLAGAFTMLQIPHPLWMWIAGVVIPIPLAWFGAHLTHNLVSY